MHLIITGDTMKGKGVRLFILLFSVFSNRLSSGCRRRIKGARTFFVAHPHARRRSSRLGRAAPVLWCVSAESSHHYSLPHITASGRQFHAGGSIPLRFLFYRQATGFARTISPFTIAKLRLTLPPGTSGASSRQ